MLKTLFHSPEFWSTGVYRAKVKTPIEFVASAVRASNANIDNLRPVANALRQMGMPSMAASPPTAIVGNRDAWVSTGALVDRMNFALSLAANRLPGITVAWATQPDDNTGVRPHLRPPSPSHQLIPRVRKQRNRASKRCWLPEGSVYPLALPFCSSLSSKALSSIGVAATDTPIARRAGQTHMSRAIGHQQLETPARSVR